MSTTLLTLVVVVAALACPAHMLWQMRRGKQAACCAPVRRDDLGRLRAHQQALGQELARRADASGAAAHGHRGAREPG